MMRGASHKALTWVAIVLSGCAILLAFYRPTISGVTFSEVVFVFGVLLSTIAFAIGAYFWVLSLSAYSHLKHIETVRADLDIMVAERKQQISVSMVDQSRVEVEGKDILASMARLFDSFLSHDVYRDIYKMLDKLVVSGTPEGSLKKEIEERSNHLLRQRARLALTNRFMDCSRRENLIRELYEVGDRSDLVALAQIEESEREGSNIRKLASAIRCLLAQRLDKMPRVELL